MRSYPRLASVSLHSIASRIGLAIVTLFVAAILVGCTRTGDFCNVAKPIRPAAADITTASDQLVEDVLAHNTYGQRACGWRP